MKETIIISEVFNCSPRELYEAWLDSTKHSEMTGGKAEITDKIGEEFTAWDGYIRGKNQELIPHEIIRQSWRTSDFGEEDEDSEVKITLTENKNGCFLVLEHTNIPEGHKQYFKGWEDHYFVPMKTYFS